MKFRYAHVGILGFIKSVAESALAAQREASGFLYLLNQNVVSFDMEKT